MDRAYNKVTKAIEYAYQIKNEGDDYVNKHLENYQCPNSLCRYKANPVALNQKKKDGTKYKVQPYFRYDEHAEGCIYSEDFGATIGTDRNGRKTLAMPYVNEITEPKKGSKDKLVVSDETSIDDKPLKPTIKSKPSTGNSGKKRKVQRTSYVSAAAIYYIQDPEEHSTENLNILKNPGTYRNQFQMIIGKEGKRFKDNKIFYSQLRVDKGVMVSDSEIIVTLNRNDPISGKRFELHMRCTGWSNQHKEGVIADIETGINTAKKTWRDGNEKQIVAFFIGKQSKDESNIFYCDHAEFCHIYVGDSFTLPFNMFGMEDIPIEMEDISTEVEESILWEKELLAAQEEDMSLNMRDFESSPPREYPEYSEIEMPSSPGSYSMESNEAFEPIQENKPVHSDKVIEEPVVAASKPKIEQHVPEQKPSLFKKLFGWWR